MSVSFVVSIIEGAGIAGVWVTAFLLELIYPRSSVKRMEAELNRKDTEITELKRALELERERSDAAVLAGSVVRDVMAGLRKELT